MRIQKHIFALLILAIATVGCKKSYFPKDIPLVEVNITRFDSALLAFDIDEPARSIESLYTNYPHFMQVYTEQILGIDYSDSAFLVTALPSFLNDTLYGFKETNQRAKQMFTNIDDIKQPLNLAFSRYKLIEPEIALPEICFFLSGFNASIFFYDDNIPFDIRQPMAIGVGVDMYLGSDYEYYNRVVYNYQKYTMRKECIPVDIVSACLFRATPFTSQKSRLLENMIYRGKIMYVLSLLFEELPENEIMGYTKDQWDWAKRNEAQVWQMMIQRKDLFKSESPVLTSYLNDGPFTSEISQEAPPRLGTWIGWQITKSYMEHNKDITLQELLHEGDAQKILENSYYKP